MFLKKTFKSLLAFVLVFLMMASSASKIEAGFDASSCTSVGIAVEKISFEDRYDNGLSGQDKVIVTVSNLSPDIWYKIHTGNDTNSSESLQYKGTPLRFELPVAGVGPALNERNLTVKLYEDVNGPFDQERCTIGTYTVTRTINLNCKIQVRQNRDGKSCDVLTDTTACVTRTEPLIVDVLVQDQNTPPQPITEALNLDIQKGLRLCVGDCWFHQNPANGQATFQLNTDDYPGNDGAYKIGVSVDTTGLNYLECGEVTYNLRSGDCITPTGEPICGKDGGLQPPPTNNAGEANPYRLCEQIPNPSLKAQCETCAGGPFGRDGVWTAIGCIKRDPKSIIKSLMQIGIGMGGGVALLSTLAGGFILSTSQGDPSKANQAKEIITNSIIGLLFIIFSVVILQFIGVTIFNIPGFGAVK